MACVIVVVQHKRFLKKSISYYIIEVRKQAVKIVSWLMLVVFLAGVAPKEYLHDVLFHHHDTVHPVYKKGEVVISGKHTHCGFLGFVFAPYVASGTQSLSFSGPRYYSAAYVLPSYHFSYSSAHTAFSLRGPPVRC